MPYAGGGWSSYAYEETSEFADADDDVDERFNGWHMLGGAEFRFARWLGVGGEIVFSRAFPTPSARAGSPRRSTRSNLGRHQLPAEDQRWPLNRTFARRVLAVVKRIPVGRVTTYGEVARLAGRPRAARAVGNILREADQPGLPYHRVIAAGGQLGGYSDLALKRALLVAEGWWSQGAGSDHFERVRWP